MKLLSLISLTVLTLVLGTKSFAHGGKPPSRTEIEQRIHKLSNIKSKSVDDFTLLGAYEGYIGHTEKALVYYNKAISLRPDSSRLYIYRGSTFEILRNYPKALNDYTTAIRLATPDRASTGYYFRAELYEETGKHALAVKDLEKMKLVSPDEKTRRLASDVERLHDEERQLLMGKSRAARKLRRK